MTATVKLMRTGAPALLPILRSDLQARLLASLLIPDGSERSCSDLAADLDAPISTVHRELVRLLGSGILTERRIDGRTVLYLANRVHPVHHHLREMLTLTYGVELLLRERLHQATAGIEMAFIFGCWARRRSGQLGPPPHVIELLVVGDPDKDRLLDLISSIANQIRVDISPTQVLAAVWAQRAEDPLLHSLSQQVVYRVAGPDVRPDRWSHPVTHSTDPGLHLLTPDEPMPSLRTDDDNPSDLSFTASPRDDVGPPPDEDPFEVTVEVTDPSSGKVHTFTGSSEDDVDRLIDAFFKI